MTTTPTVKVWDRFVRVFHWTLVLSFVVAWQSTEQIGWLHKGFGYLALALVLARLVWGVVGSATARFANFVPSPGKLLRYLGALLRLREPRHLGHNPAGAVMIVFLLTAMVVVGITGWMMTLDAFWGNDSVETLHVATVDVLLVAVCIHVGANLYASLRHRENLVASMFTGHKRADAGDATAPR